MMFTDTEGVSLGLLFKKYILKSSLKLKKKQPVTLLNEDFALMFSCEFWEIFQ